MGNKTNGFQKNRSFDERILKAHPFLRRFRKCYQDGIINAFLDAIDCQKLTSPKQIIEQLYMDCDLYDQGSIYNGRNWKYFLHRAIRKYRGEAVSFAKAVLCERVSEEVEFPAVIRIGFESLFCAVDTPPEHRKNLSENRCDICNCMDDIMRHGLCRECCEPAQNKPAVPTIEATPTIKEELVAEMGKELEYEREF
ncbi:hypothetical protein C4588_05805 [Candidatus Parcubacteria bacterium]|nr:MAG: hypothetical protein C4588_05805 [Candidatus Parcubacteria bacterium]